MNAVLADRKNVIVVGNGSREDAIGRSLRQARRTRSAWLTPGNPGVVRSTSKEPLDCDGDLFVIGPEAPLVAGLADKLRAQGKLVVGPGAEGAKIEGSKRVMKEIAISAGVPTASYQTFTDPDEAVAYLRSTPGPWVVKTDGLAGGKGVLVAFELKNAEDDVIDKLSGNSFGKAGTTVVVESYLGPPEKEMSSFWGVVVNKDKIAAVRMGNARDYKRVGTGDTGENTGGMGCFSPVPAGDAEMDELIHDVIIMPYLREMQKRGIDYQGFLYAGLMLTENGPMLVEFNVRLGGPEAEVIVPRIKPDSFFELCLSIADGTLENNFEVEFEDEHAVTVICATQGYPASPRTGDVIEGIDNASKHATVYMGGVELNLEGKLITAGGRVLAVTGRGKTLEEARQNAYRAVTCIRWVGMHFREDIALAA